MKKLFVLFVLGAAALTACGGDAPKPADPTTSSGDPTKAATDATKTAPSATPSATPPADPTKK